MGGCRRPRRTFTATGSPTCNLLRVGQNTPPLPLDGWYPAWNSRTFFTTNSVSESVSPFALPVCLRELAFVLAEGMLTRGSGKFLLTDDFDYELPDGLIATQPALHRDASRLLILSKDDGERNHCFFRDLPRYLRSRSLIVLNDTRVIPARLSAHKPTGGRVEVFLVEPVAADSAEQAVACAPGTWSETWRVLVRGLGHCPLGTRLAFAAPFAAEVAERGERGVAVLRFVGTGQGGLLSAAEPVGEIPLPPYIEAARRRSELPTWQSSWDRRSAMG